MRQQNPGGSVIRLTGVKVRGESEFGVNDDILRVEDPDEGVSGRCGLGEVARPLSWSGGYGFIC